MLDANLNSMTVMGINAETGTEKQLSSRRWFQVGQIAWMPDESGLVIAGTSQSWITYQLWYLSYPAGHAQQISNDLNDYGRVSLTGDGKRLVTIQLNRLSNLWVAPTTNVSGAKQITVGSGTWASQLSWTPDGRIVYVIITNFQSDQIFSFAWSRDGKQLALARGTQTSSVVLIHNSEWYASRIERPRPAVWEDGRRSRGGRLQKEVIWRQHSFDPKRPDGEGLAAAFYLFVAPPLVVEQVASKANPVFDTPASIEMAGRLRS